MLSRKRENGCRSDKEVAELCLKLHTTSIKDVDPELMKKFGVFPVETEEGAFFQAMMRLPVRFGIEDRAATAKGNPDV
jgi:hypothetical protein